MPVTVATGAIVFTDIVGFTQLTAERGDEIALALLEKQDDLVRRALPECGRVVKELGDGLLLWFDEAPHALDTCLELQRRFRDVSNEDVPLWVRMGFHWGAPRRRGDDLVGHDVNLASRIAELAGPGELLLSAAAAEAVGDSSRARLEELGPVWVRGIVEPVRLYRVAPLG